jgi:hypothetical protein
MSRLARLQLVGPSILFAIALAAEAAAYGLSHAPSSEMLWYINLRVFGIFQRSYYFLDSYTGIPAFELFFIALPLLVLAFFGVAFQRRLMLAISCNLSFVYAGFLLYSWDVTQPRTLAASLSGIAVPTGPDLYLIGILLGSSLLSCVVSHLVFLRTVRPGSRRCIPLS